MKLQGKVAIVTGGARGIGSAIVQRFLEEGASVYVADPSPGETLQSSQYADRVTWSPVDIADPASHDALLAPVLARFERVDILVNNAGIQIREPILQAQPDHWDRIFSVNLKGPFFLTQRVARHMPAGGSIINVSSIHDDRPARGNAMYSISKGGMRMMTRCQALEFADQGIRVNAIAPGAVATDINRDVLANPAFRHALEQRIPLKRIGAPEDIAGVAVFLASSDSSYMTGATLYVDGGLILQ